MDCSSAVQSVEPLAHAMKEWRADADEIVAHYVKNSDELKIMSTLLDSCAVGDEHEDADNQSKYKSKYTLAHTKVSHNGAAK